MTPMTVSPELERIVARCKLDIRVVHRPTVGESLGYWRIGKASQWIGHDLCCPDRDSATAAYLRAVEELTS